MSDSIDLETATLRAREARERLMGTAQEIQTRLAPSKLFDDAVVGVKTGAAELAQTAGDAARRQPGILLAGAALVAALLVRKPLGRLGRKLRRK